MPMREATRARDCKRALLVSALLACLACGRTSPGSVSQNDGGTGATPVDVLTQRIDAQRSNVNSHETVLTTSNVNTDTFGKLFTLPVDSLVWAQPLFVSNYKIGNQTHNVLIVATAHNSVYAFDADTPGAPLWHVNFGPSVPSSIIPTTNIQVEIGNLSTPVIDRDSGLLYITNKVYFDETQSHQLHVLSLATGTEMPGSPVTVTASIPTPGGGPAITFEAGQQAQRPGLLLEGGIVYLAFASHEDLSPWHGWILGYRYDLGPGSRRRTSGMHRRTGSTRGYGKAAKGLPQTPPETST